MFISLLCSAICIFVCNYFHNISKDFLAIAIPGLSVARGLQGAGQVSPGIVPLPHMMEGNAMLQISANLALLPIIVLILPTILGNIHLAI